MSSTELSEKIAAHIAEKAAIKIDDFEKKIGKVKENVQATGISNESEENFRKEVLANQEKFKPVNWLTDAARRAGQMQKVTHVLKFTHTSAEGSSLYFSSENKYPANMAEGGVISTASLPNLDPDFVGNAASLDIIKLLLIQDEGKSLLDFLIEGDISPLAPFAESETQLKDWLKGFMKILAAKELASHTSSKQIYFPIEKGEYHLLSPLHASSFSHAVYKQVQKSRFSEQSKLARQAKRESKYSSERVVEYPNTAVQAFGGTKPQNVSQLNSARGGKLYLLSCSPPVWESSLKPPVETKTIFSQNHFESRVRKEIRELRDRFKKQVNKKSIKSVRDYIKKQIDLIIDRLIQYGAEIRNLKDQSGWSASPKCKLSLAERLWLDPYRKNDVSFALELEKGDWREDIANKFAHWLNRRLNTKELSFGDVEHREWKGLLERALRLLQDDLEVGS